MYYRTIPSQKGGLRHQSLHHQANASSPRITRAARLGANRAPQFPRLSIPTCRLSTIVNHMRLGTPNVVRARYGASFCTKYRPVSKHQKDFTHSSRCALRQWPCTRRPVSYVTTRGTIPVTTPGFQSPLTGPDQWKI